MDCHGVLEQGVYSSQIGGKDQTFVLSVCLTSPENLFLLKENNIKQVTSEKKVKYWTTLTGFSTIGFKEKELWELW